jgi:hypothetical protein
MAFLPLLLANLRLDLRSLFATPGIHSVHLGFPAAITFTHILHFEKKTFFVLGKHRLPIYYVTNIRWVWAFFLKRLIRLSNRKLNVDNLLNLNVRTKTSKIIQIYGLIKKTSLLICCYENQDLLLFLCKFTKETVLLLFSRITLYLSFFSKAFLNTHTHTHSHTHIHTHTHRDKPLTR